MKFVYYGDWHRRSSGCAGLRLLPVLSVLLVFRLALLQGSLPRFSNQDNPAAFHPSRLVR
ncbi:Transmembrane and TPR repeat-containing protein 3 [Gryllus bimaculatus]|nr:Transmembrane and TPR repeat-containing protein 3 [Gryllus bimaculatus]